MIKQLIMIADKNKTLKKILLLIYTPTIGRYRAKKRNMAFKANGREALFAIDKVFHELGISYWLEFGTMLGAVREKDFIGHDQDIDLACFFDKHHEENEKVFNRYGFEKIQEIVIDNGKYGREETYRYKNVDIDIFYFHRRDNEMYCHAFTKLEGKTWISTIEEIGGLVVRELKYPYTGFTTIKFLGGEFLIPSNIEEHLSASYGVDYMIKDPNYSNSIATNVRIIQEKIGILHEYIR